MRCDKCVHWRPEAASDQPEGTGECAKIFQLKDAIFWEEHIHRRSTRRIMHEHDDQLAFVADSDERNAFLITRAGFYCAHFTLPEAPKGPDLLRPIEVKPNLKAVQIYCEGVAADFPELKQVMDNIMILAGITKPA